MVKEFRKIYVYKKCIHETHMCIHWMFASVDFAEKSSTIAQRSQAEMHLCNPLLKISSCVSSYVVLLQKNQLELLYLNPSITKLCSLTAERP